MARAVGETSKGAPGREKRDGGSLIPVQRW